MTNLKVISGDCRETLKGIPDGTVQMCVTSPPYWGLRSYLPKDHPDKAKEIGQEKTPEAYVETMVGVFREVRRCLHASGTLWLNIGDTYCGGDRKSQPTQSFAKDKIQDRPLEYSPSRNMGGHPFIKPKDLCLIPERLLIALQLDGWWVRSKIIWNKKSCMPESITDRPTGSWEPIYLLAKSERYYYDSEAVKELKATPGKAKEGEEAPSVTRNQRNVWTLGPEPYKEAHFATFPTEIPRRAILAGTSELGCCPQCFAPWKRVKKSHREWTPTCECEGHNHPVPCTVLDPFGGSGTSGAVALELSRNAIICELKEEYLPLIERRTKVTPELKLG